MKEGYLNLNESGRYELLDEQGNYLTYFTCGELIDIYDPDKEEWLQGRIEHNDNYNGYYFFNPNGRHRSLWNGVKARIL